MRLIIRDSNGDEIKDIDLEVGLLREQIYNSYPNVEAEAGSIVSITDGADGIPVKSLVVGIEPVQSGSGDPSPDNVRPISGWTGTNVQRVGKNLLPTLSNTTITGITYTVNADGSILINGTSIGTAVAYFALGGTTDNSLLGSGAYTLSAFNTGITGEAYLQVTVRRKNTTDVINRVRITPSTPIRTFTISDSEYVSDIFIRLSTGAVATNAVIYPQIELGSTAAAYEPYAGTTYPITFPSEAGTVYGGSLDVTNGVLTVDRAMVDMGTLTWIKSSGTVEGQNAYSVALANVGEGMKPRVRYAENTMISSQLLPCDSTVWYISYMPDNSMMANETRLYVCANAYATAGDFKAAMSGVQLCYELATPQTYQLTPTEVSTLLGSNAIWADTGDVSLAYRADTKLYIDRIYLLQS